MTDAQPRPRIDGAVFDLDGVIVDSEHLWEEAWTDYCAGAGYEWTHTDTITAQGMSTPEWSGYIARKVGRTQAQREIADFCIAFMIRRIVQDGEGAPLNGARELVAALGDRVPIALASSASRPVIDAVLGHHDLASRFTATVSSEEVPEGKPSPDVYLEAVRRLGLRPEQCLAIEDSTNGILAAHAAGLFVVAIPNATYPPKPAATDVADYVAADHSDAAAFVSALLCEGSTR